MSRTLLYSVLFAVGGILGVSLIGGLLSAHAQTQTGPLFSFVYRVPSADELIQFGRNDPKFANAPASAALEAGMNRMGRLGWRYAGCIPGSIGGGYGGGCQAYIFEWMVGSAPAISRPATPTMPISPAPAPP
jgi:hypothetical protein